MASYIHNLSIGQYRGINSMVISDLNNINLIVGDNNSGKTTLLETVFLLRSPDSFGNVLNTAKLRTSGFFASATPYENLMSVFPKGSNQIFVQADGTFGNVSLKVVGEEIMTEVGEEDIKNHHVSMRYTGSRDIIGSEITAFVGSLYSSMNANREELPIRFTAISRNYSPILNRKFINIEYLSPISHITENTFNRIVRMDGYKQICIELIRLFDPQIEDLVYMRNELTGRAVEYIKSKKLGLMPLSTYGDGIKKVLSLANAIIESAGGILLIDEIDTSIHYKYYEDIFSFLIKACMKFDVQVFITTHSKEAIDEILKTQNYDEQQKDKFADPINVITFRKDDNGNIRSRSMSGFDVHSNRELFDFEVRL